MRSIATMIVTSRTTGMLLVNQLPAGQVGPDEAISVPMPDEGHCFLTFLPYDDHALPLHKLLHWHEGRPRLDEACKGGVELTLWPHGRTDAYLLPREVAEPPAPTLVPELWLRQPFSLEGRSLTASLVYQGIPYLVIDDGQGTVELEQPLPCLEQPMDLRVVECEGRLGVVATGQVQGRPWACLAAQNDEGFAVGLNQACDEMAVDETGATLLEYLGDTAGHVQRTRWTPAGSQRDLAFQDDAPRSPVTAQQGALCLLEALLLGQDEEAVACLSQPLREALSAEQLREYLGPFTGIVASTTAREQTETQVCWATLRPTAPGVQEARSIIFEMVFETGDEGGWRVDNMLFE